MHTFRAWWRYGRWPLVAGVLAALVWIIAQGTFIGPDYYYTYYSTGRYWLDGAGPLYTYTYEQTDVGFYNAPWLLFALIPFALLPLNYGQAIWHVATLLALLGAIHGYTRPHIPLIAIALSVTNLFTVDMLLRGQIDAFILGGTVLGWWAIHREKALTLGAALTILAVKPPNLLLTILLFLIAVRGWPRRDILRVFAVPLLVTLVTTLVVGVDWPLRYLDNYVDRPLIDYLSITLWRGLDLAGVPKAPFIGLGLVAVIAFLRVAWRDGLTARTLSLALTTNLVFTLYANGNHYVILIPAFLYVFRYDWRLGVLVGMTSWTPLLRGPLGYEAAVFDLGYVLLLWLGAWLLPDAAVPAAPTVTRTHAQ